MTLPSGCHKSGKIGWQTGGMIYDPVTAPPGGPDVSVGLNGPLGVFVDGENLQSWAAEPILALVARHPALRLCRVYGNYEHLDGWRNVPGFEVVHTGVPGTGGDTLKNAADIKIAVDVMEFALREGARTVVLCSSDRDFTPLVLALRRAGVQVVGVGEAKAAESFRAACTAFHILDPSSVMTARPACAPRPLAQGVAADVMAGVLAKVREELGPYIGRTQGMPLKAFGSAMGQQHKVRVKELGYKRWREFAVKNPEVCTLVGEGDMTFIMLAPTGK